MPNDATPPTPPTPPSPRKPVRGDSVAIKDSAHRHRAKSTRAGFVRTFCVALSFLADDAETAPRERCEACEVGYGRPGV